MFEIMWYCRETRRKTEKENCNQYYREKPVCSTQLEEFKVKESGAFYKDRDAVVDGNLVSSLEEAFTPHHVPSSN